MAELKDFYYNEPPIRVQATRFEQITAEGAAQCNDFYEVAWTWIYGTNSGYRESGVSYQSGYPPFEIKIIQPGQTHPYISNYSVQTPEAYLSTHKANGQLQEPNGYDRPGGRNSASGFPAWFKVCRQSAAPRYIYASQSKDGYKLATGVSYPGPYPHEGGSGYYCQSGALPDDCGGSCETFFYQDSQLIHKLASCPPISEQPPGCDCCKDLLSLAKGISV